eukprot:3640814-Heterocapsa_arctica.AAC.1
MRRGCNAVPGTESGAHERVAEGNRVGHGFPIESATFSDGKWDGGGLDDGAVGSSAFFARGGGGWAPQVDIIE